MQSNKNIVKKCLMPCSWELYYPLSICTWFLKSLFHEIELDFWTWFFVYFAGYTGSKNQVWNRQQIVCQAWFSKLGFKYRSIGGYALHASWIRIWWHLVTGASYESALKPNKKGQMFVAMLSKLQSFLGIGPFKASVFSSATLFLEGNALNFYF